MKRLQGFGINDGSYCIGCIMKSIDKFEETNSDYAKYKQYKKCTFHRGKCV
jgi:hypothetical protein